ncbi:hypothetical protein CR513_41672, partial [Mucuna pruriens]
MPTRHPTKGLRPVLLKSRLSVVHLLSTTRSPCSFTSDFPRSSREFLRQWNIDISKLHMKALAAQRSKESIPSESNPPFESKRVLAVIESLIVVESTSVLVELTSVLVELTLETALVLQTESPNATKRKAASAVADEEARRKKGKAIAISVEERPTRTQPATASLSLAEGNFEPRVLVAFENPPLVPKLPLGRLAYWVAPSRCKSMWSTNFLPHSLAGPNFCSSFDHAALLKVEVQGSLDMMAFYHIRSLSEQIIQRESYRKAEIEKLRKSLEPLKSKNGRLKSANDLKSEIEGLKSKNKSLESESKSLKSKAALLREENSESRNENFEVLRTSDELLKDLSVTNKEASLTSEKTKIASLEGDLKWAKEKAT